MLRLQYRPYTVYSKNKTHSETGNENDYRNKCASGFEPSGVCFLLLLSEDAALVGLCSIDDNKLVTLFCSAINQAHSPKSKHKLEFKLEHTIERQQQMPIQIRVLHFRQLLHRVSPRIPIIYLFSFRVTTHWRNHLLGCLHSSCQPLPSHPAGHFPCCLAGCFASGCTVMPSLARSAANPLHEAPLIYYKHKPSLRSISFLL